MKHGIRGLLLAGILMIGSQMIAISAMSQTTFQVIPVWDGVAPGSENCAQKKSLLDLSDSRFSPPNPDTLVWNVTRPTLAVFKPAPGGCSS
jgi:hypothetical protein